MKSHKEGKAFGDNTAFGQGQAEVLVRVGKGWEAKFFIFVEHHL